VANARPKPGEQKMGQPDESQFYSYADYLLWDEKSKWEIIGGVPYAIFPAPLRIHQEIIGNLYFKIRQYLEGKSCKLYLAPFDVRIPDSAETNDQLIQHVVQPDLSVICDPFKLDERGCLGAPDWIIEVLSPATSSKDLNQKFRLYESAGVKEYWVVYPAEQVINLFRLEKGKFVFAGIFARLSSVQVITFPDLLIDLREIFEDPLKEVQEGPATYRI
jgi:Uma2 family endonuclease